MMLQEKESFRTTSEDSFHLTGEKAQPKDMVSFENSNVLHTF